MATVLKASGRMNSDTIDYNLGDRPGRPTRGVPDAASPSPTIRLAFCRRAP
jgi:hypothetical protein